MTTAEYDLRYLRAGIDQLENYLLSRDIYRPIGVNPPSGEPTYPPLTLGWLLLSRLVAKAVSLEPSEQAELEDLSSRLEVIRTSWRSAWSKKAEAEFHSRLNLWRDFLEDIRKDPNENRDRFAYENNRRVLLELLLPEAEKLPEADRKALAGLDTILRSRFLPGEFVWDPRWKSSFPASTYWYLYGSLSRTEARE